MSHLFSLLDSRGILTGEENQIYRRLQKVKLPFPSKQMKRRITATRASRAATTTNTLSPQISRIRVHRRAFARADGPLVLADFQQLSNLHPAERMRGP